MDAGVTDPSSSLPHDWVFVAPSAALYGDVQVGPRANVWFGTQLRGEAAPVVLEACANVQDNCLVEGAPGHPARLGRYAAMGHNARVIGATVEERALIAIGATVLPGARVGTNSIVAANAVVPEGMRVPPRSLVVGQGRIVREVTPDEIDRVYRTGDNYQRLAEAYLATWETGSPSR